MSALLPEFLPPANALPFDPVEFALTYQFATEMALAKSPTCNPTDHGLSIRADDGKVTHFRFTDNFVNRFGFAVANRYRLEPRKSRSFLYRWIALMSLVEAQILDERFQRRGVGEAGDEIAGPVLALAATFPLNEHGFDQASFLAELQKCL